MMGIPLHNTLLLASAVFIGGFVDSLAGGGGLVSLPAYLAAGLAPRFLLGTNKLSAFMGTAIAGLKYSGHLEMPRPLLRRFVLLALAGALTGAWLSTLINPAFMRYVLLGAIPVVAFLIVRESAFAGGKNKVPPAPFRASAAAAAISCYDGFFGPGAGTFFAVTLTKYGGYDLLKATALAKILNLATNMAALGFFLATGRVDITLGVVMGLVSMAGNWCGAHVGIKKGHKIIRPLLLTVCGLLWLKLLLF